MTNPKNDSIRWVLMLTVLSGVSASCFDFRPHCCAGGGDSHRRALRQRHIDLAHTVPEATDAASVGATMEMDQVCREIQVDLWRTVEHLHADRAIKVIGAGGLGMAGFKAGTCIGHTLGPTTGLTMMGPAGKLVAAKHAGILGAGATAACGTLIPVGIGGCTFLGSYMHIQKHQKEKDRRVLTDVLADIRKRTADNVPQGDAMCLAACRRNMKATLYTGRSGEDWSGEVSLYQRSTTLEGLKNCEDALLYKCLPVHKIGLITHGIYHSPAVPIHETLMSLIAYGKAAGWTAATLASLTTFLTSPAIPAAGFPICFAVYTACHSILPKLYEDAAIAYQTLLDTSEDKRPEDLSLDDFFGYRSKVHCNFETLDHPFFQKEYPAAFRHIFGGRHLVRNLMAMSGPTYLDEKVVRKERSLRGVCKTTPTERANAGKAGMPIDTVARLAEYRAHVLETAGQGQYLDSLADAIKATAEPGHTESWSVQRLQENFGLTFPTVASRTEGTSKHARFDLTGQEGRLQYACYLWALATKGDVGISVTLDQFNKSPFWGAPRSTNMWIGSEVFYQNERYRIESVTPVNEHANIDVVLERVNVDTMQQERVTIKFAAERTLEAAAHHGGAHGGVAAGVIGGAGAVVATGGLAIPLGVAAGAAVLGGAAGTFKDYGAEATDAKEVAQLKMADLYPFHNDVAQFAWDIQYKSLSAILETLKLVIEPLSLARHQSPDDAAAVHTTAYNDDCQQQLHHTDQQQLRQQLLQSERELAQSLTKQLQLDLEQREEQLQTETSEYEMWKRTAYRKANHLRAVEYQCAQAIPAIIPITDEAALQQSRAAWRAAHREPPSWLSAPREVRTNE